MSFEYLKAAVGGLDKNAVLEQLMDAYGRDVWNYAYFMTGKRELSDDVAQDTFVKAYERLVTFRGGSSVKTWLLSITRNTARDALRSAWLKRVSLFRMPDERIRTMPSAEQAALDGLVTEQLWLEVMALPRKLRETLLLHAHHGLSHREIADLLGISEGTVKSRLHRARAAMGRKLGVDDTDNAAAASKEVSTS